MPQRIPPDVAGQVAVLFIEESAAVFRSALRAARGNRAEADDFTQEAFHAGALNWAVIKDWSPARKRAWLCRVAINKAVDSYRAEKLVRPTAEPHTTTEAASAEDLALPRIVKDHCLKVIGDMPEKRRIVAYLRFHEEWTYAEIAGHLGITVGGVRAHAHAARAALHAAIGPGVHPAGEADVNAETGEEEL